MATNGVGESRESSNCFALYNAAVSGDWEKAYTLFFQQKPEEIKAAITSEKETALHVAVQSGKANYFVGKLVGLMSREALALKDSLDETALHKAAKVGNKKAAMAMVEKNPDLLYMLCSEGRLAVTIAAQYGQKDTLEYLISVSKPNVVNTPFEGKLGIALFIQIIGCQFFDVALDLVKKYPDLARLGFDNSHSCALSFIAEMENVFPIRVNFSYYENLIYHCAEGVSLEHEYSSTSVPAGDIEDPTHRRCSTWFQIINGGNEEAFSTVLDICGIFRNKKEKRKQAHELVKYLCREMKLLPENDALSMLKDSIFKAAEHGISEIVEVIMEMFPIITTSVDSTGKTIMHLAASNRSKNVFNIIYSMSDRKYLFSGVDNEGNNLMHMCARLPPPHRLSHLHGAALQLQHELQWFYGMQIFIPPSGRNCVNKDGITPKELFTEQHQDLKAQGEKWMKDSATACSITAALIATVVFAAAFAVPGGVSSNTGIPVLSTESAFYIFTMANATSLFSSLTSLLIFLSIITSRYAEEDFLHVLPMKLSLGLLILYVSIISMMSSFSAALYIACHDVKPLFAVLVVIFGWWPVAAFMLLQLPLHTVIFLSYSVSIFHKRTDGQFY